MHQPQHEDFKLYQLSEKAVTIDFGNEINGDIFNRVQGLNRLIQEHPLPGLRDTVPAYTTLTICYDPIALFNDANLQGPTGLEKVRCYLGQLNDLSTAYTMQTTEALIIPVCYGGFFGPDLREVAAVNGLSDNDVIDIHTSATYQVYMIGFVPGFAYMGGMPETIAAPRKPAPRPAIPAGSVGIAGKQTGIYPLETPGGWQLIGRTPLRLFDAGRPQPSLLKAGDRVQFKAITQTEFESYGK